MSDDIRIARNDEQHRYEILVDGEIAGFTEFEEDAEGRLVFPHTEIDPAYGGRGLGTKLVASAMADEATRGDVIVPECPFIVTYLQKHDVPGLQIAWRERDIEIAEHASTAERTPGDEGVGTPRG
ncbi:N-acetyltransferase [Microbacterium sp. VKM Ac-2870]|uniref:GNAT family N-acetyltransferase n=1 Tax=Microbacterium sp. VKM Ac-2870 TaxID=2783825 RepID=UPI00188D1818|nr:GNAT family N-acetyltransferase [Microbacterium sp. VKM Ac-2870]MBF4562732.1 N-acetyltransferase [Microbacterium sp. VKM Ac-2870]